MKIAHIATAIGAAAVTLFVALDAQAYCVYNRGHKDIDVWGEDCPACYKGSIKAGSKACCPGGEKGCRGETWITFTGPHTPGVHYYCKAQVPAHGWVNIRNDGHPEVCIVYNKEGGVLSKSYAVASKWPKRD